MRQVVLLMIAAGVSPAQASEAQVNSASSTIQMGAVAWDAGNYARALELWRPLAEAGDPDAQYNLAQAYRLGRGVPANPAQALDWYLKAARQEHPEAQGNYGLMLFQTGRRREALPWLEKAAGRGDARAQYVLGTALFNGDVAGRDWVRAYAMMTRAAAAGLPQARTSLAEMGRLVPLGQRRQATALARDLERSEVLTNAGAAPAGALVRASDPGRPTARPMPSPTVAASQRRSARPSPAALVEGSPSARPMIGAPAQATQRVGDSALTPSAGGWRVQLGAYAAAASANAAWQGIVARMPGMALRPFTLPAGAVTRLQAGPFAARAQAALACARISAATGTACFPVPAR